MEAWNAVALVFSLALLGTTFAASLTSKVRDRDDFVNAVRRFDIVPARWSGPVAWWLLTAEAAVVALLAVGMVAATGAGVAGLALGTVLLVGYSIALIAVRVRGMRVACNCFGANPADVSWYDIARNGLLIAAAVTGVASADASARLPAADAILVGLVAVTAAVIVINLGDLVETVRRPGALD